MENWTIEVALADMQTAGKLKEWSVEDAKKLLDFAIVSLYPERPSEFFPERIVVDKDNSGDITRGEYSGVKNVIRKVVSNPFTFFPKMIRYLSEWFATHESENKYALYFKCIFLLIDFVNWCKENGTIEIKMLDAQVLYAIWDLSTIIGNRPTYELVLENLHRYAEIDEINYGESLDRLERLSIIKRNDNDTLIEICDEIVIKEEK
jgi:hypothetical protein